MNASGYIRPGEGFVPSARVWNGLVDLKKEMDRHDNTTGPGNATRNKPVTVFVTGGASGRKYGDVVGIGDAVSTPETDEWVEWRYRQIYEGVTPEESKPWGIVTGTASGANDLTPVCVFGTVAAIVSVSDAAHTYAHINASGALVSGTSGQARILWAAPAPEEDYTPGDPWDAWCLLSMGSGKPYDALPLGYIRLYRGEFVGAITAGEWVYANTEVSDSASNVLGRLVGTSDGTPPVGLLAIPQTDMPDPYSSAVPSGIANEDRTDYCIASIAMPSVLHSGTGPFLVPASTTGGGIGSFDDLTFDDVQELFSATSPTALQTWQKKNVWTYVGSHIIKTDTSLFTCAGPGLTIDEYNRIRIDAVIPSTVGANPVALCATGGGLIGFQEITEGSGGGADVSSGSPAIVIGEEVAGYVPISLQGDAAESQGLYAADGSSNRAFIPIGGSVKLSSTPKIELEGDAEAPTTGTDVLLYAYDRSPTLDADKKRKFLKVGTNGGLAVSATEGATGIRLAGTTDTAPAIGSVWGRVSSTEYGWFSPIVVVIS